MPAPNEKTAHFFKLVRYYQEHRRLPKGMGKASKHLRETANRMSKEKAKHFTHT